MVIEEQDIGDAPAVKDDPSRGPRLHQQSARPASSAPGASTTPAESARPVSDPPGAPITSMAARPVSIAPGVAGEPLEEMTADRTELRWTVGSENSHRSDILQSKTSGSSTLHGSYRFMHVNQSNERAVDHSLAEHPTTRNSCALEIGISLTDKYACGDLTGLGSAGIGHMVGLADLSSHGHANPSPCPAHDSTAPEGKSIIGPAQDSAALDEESLKGPILSKEPVKLPNVAEEQGSNLGSGLDSFRKSAQAHDHPNDLDLLEDNDNYCNLAKPPSNFNPPPNFNWVFLHGCWTLVPTRLSKEFPSRSLEDEDLLLPEHTESWCKGIVAEDTGPEPLEQVLEGSGQVGDSFDSKESDGSESDFEEKIKRLLQSGHTEDTSKCTRRCERRKKPSSRWTEEAGFIPQPPRSCKKKGVTDTTPEAPDAKKAKLEEPLSKIQRSLEFLSSHGPALDDAVVPPPWMRCSFCVFDPP